MGLSLNSPSPLFFKYLHFPPKKRVLLFHPTHTSSTFSEREQGIPAPSTITFLDPPRTYAELCELERAVKAKANRIVAIMADWRVKHNDRVWREIRREYV